MRQEVMLGTEQMERTAVMDHILCLVLAVLAGSVVVVLVRELVVMVDLAD